MMDEGDLMTVTFEDAHAGLRLDKALSVVYPEISRARIQALIGEGAVTLDGLVIENGAQKIRGGQVATLEVPPSEDAAPEPENIPLDVVHEDDDIIVIHKPAGLVVHPAAGHARGTLVNALLYHCRETLSGINGVKRPGIVHRLDKDTSGLMVVAKTDRAHRSLAAQLKNHTMGRIYWGISCGVPVPPLGSITHPLGRHPQNRFYVAVIPRGGREATTHYKVLERFRDQFALVEYRLETGRTHQIRVHSAAQKFPLLGDPLYGPQATQVAAKLKAGGWEEDTPAAVAVKGLARQALHARGLHLSHPATGEAMEFQADLPEDLSRLLEGLKG